jgi:hypothetical protein
VYRITVKKRNIIAPGLRLPGSYLPPIIQPDYQPSPPEPCPVFTECTARGGILIQSPDNPQEPPTGGCGAGPFLPLIPDRPFGMDFTPCCGAHDSEYTRCDVDGDPNRNSNLDQTFCACVHNQCKGKTSLERLLCDTAASIYCFAVEQFGPTYYCNAQQRHCECVGVGQWPQ